MLSKYKIKPFQLGLKSLTLFLSLCLSIQVMSQINGGEMKETEKNKKEKKEKVKRDSLTGTQLFIIGFGQYAYRDFEDQSVYNIYSLRNDESSSYNGGATIGLSMPFIGNFRLGLGLSYFGHGEEYHYNATTTDSSFNYRRSYMQIGLPLKFEYVYGDKIQVFGFAGIMPLNILNIRYEEDYVKEDGSVVEQDLDLIKEGFTPFNVMASVGVGINYNLEYFGFTLYPEYRRHLMNTFADSPIPLNHKMYGVALNFGMYLRF